MDPEHIRLLLRRSTTEQWSYPQFFDALKRAGVDYYLANVERRRVTYFGGKNLWEERFGSAADPLTIAPALNREGMLQAITRNQNKETTYPQFLEELAAAGITS